MTILIRTVLVLSVAASAVAVGEMMVALRWMRSRTQWNALFFPSGGFLVMSVAVLVGLWPNPNPGTAGLLLCAITLLLAMGAVIGVASMLRLMRAQQTRDDDATFLRIRYQRLFKQNELPILVSEAESLRIVDANAAAATLFEIPMESLVALTVLDLGIEEDSSELTVPADLAARTAPGLRHRAPSGAERELVMHRSVVGVGEKHLHYDIIEDVSERNAARRALLEQKDLLAHLADHDALTGLPNRRVLGVALERAVAHCARGASAVLMFIDVDDFKSVNDEQGHQAGDAALVAIAQILSGAVREGDVVARIGGDEFAVLLESADVPSAKDIADRLEASTKEAFPGLGLSIGVTDVAVTHDAADALRIADRRMYQAKNGGKGRIVVDG